MWLRDLWGRLTPHTARNLAGTAKPPVNFNPVQAVTNLFDFSRFEGTAPDREVVTDLGLTGERLLDLLSQPYGLSETLKDNFSFLRTRTGKLKATLRLSYVFESFGREASYEDLAAKCGASCNTCYQQGLSLREVYSNAFGLVLTSTKEGLHLVSQDELRVKNARLLSNFDAQVKGLLKFQQELGSVVRTGADYQLGERTRLLLEAALTTEEEV